MGSAVERKYIQIQDDGSSVVDFNDPILSINGEIDGLMRQSRVAEQAWHLNKNINDAQKGQFYVSVIQGLNHAQFAQKPYPKWIFGQDLSSELTEWLGWKAIEAQLTPFILNLVNDKLDQFKPVGGEFLEPLP